MDMSPTIIPKSDQLNADDLVCGPITITIKAVNKGSAEQPVSISFEGDNGRPYKPSKSMRRVLINIWGKEASVYIGRRLTLFRDPSVKYAGVEVGGVKISHASHITEPTPVLLTVSRGIRKPYVVEPLEETHVDAFGPLPEAWVGWTNEERGDYMATRGLEKLQAWWASLPKGPDKKALEARLRNDWKPAAEKASPTT